MEKLVELIASGKEWIFSGIGVAIITALISGLLKRKKKVGKGGKEKPVIVKNIVHTHAEIDNSSGKDTSGQQRKKGTTQKHSEKTSQNAVRVGNIRFYMTGIKGKVYNTSIFRNWR